MITSAWEKNGNASAHPTPRETERKNFFISECSEKEIFFSTIQSLPKSEKFSCTCFIISILSQSQKRVTKKSHSERGYFQGFAECLYLEQAHHATCFEFHDSTLYEFDKASHSRFDIDHRVVCTFKPLTEQMTMKLCKLRGLIRKSSTLKLTVLRGRTHRTHCFLWRVVSLSSQTFELKRKNLLIILDIMPHNYICRTQYSGNDIYFFSHSGCIDYVLIINSIHLRCTERNRNGWFQEKIVSFDLMIHSIFLYFAHERSKLDNMWLLGKISSLGRETRCFCIPDTNLHSHLFMVENLVSIFISTPKTFERQTSAIS